MNLVAGVVAGALIGWFAFAILKVNLRRGLRASILLGIVGGALGMQLAPMITAGPVIEDQLNVFHLIVAAAGASACLIIGNMIAARRSG